ncbi:TetR/AcrR family transcriptional regulator [Fodinicola feengrottensis]|uniref:HTH tetR-type domain-containing protein n=1 Tax=Fodinicola feengrottensis TaxID=435914 RepID=A0ABN2JDN1_9ACTN|nr:TetR/AcrR family transcriptional regulator [Fodinicola feengrottensis]
MVRKPTGKPGSNAWQWSRTAETRRGLLEAARAVFVERGFAEASVADVVERASSSVGSLYHHFGGKTELFLALWEDHHATQEQKAITAVAKARTDGEEDPLVLFIAGARAFLEGAWQHRDLARLFMDGDGPPGFALIRRASNREWIRQNAVLLEAGTDPVERMTVSILTSIIGEASREVATCASKREANRITEATVRLIRRLDPLRDTDG